MEQHNARVQVIAASVKAFADVTQQFRINHGSTNSTRNQRLKDTKNVVDVSSLNNVLKVDPISKVAIVEPNVPMDRLIEATLAYGSIPPVVMDFPGITVGGGYAGTACESSSFKHGFFDKTINRIEMVLPSGEIVHCSAIENEDLFYGAAGAMGTLGVVVLLEIRLELASSYVETTYHRVSSIEEAVVRIRAFTTAKHNFDYIDGIMFSETSGAVITGRRTDFATAGLAIQRFSAPSDPWYAWHVEECIKDKQDPVTELIPLPEYLFRYDRGGFWVGHSIFKYSRLRLPFNKFTRRILDRFMHTRMLYAMMHSQSINAQIIQDMAVPYSSATEFLHWTAQNIKIWPLWLCPLKQSSMPTLHPHNQEVNADGEPVPMLNVGIWGAPKELNLRCFLDDNQSLEAKLRSIGGMKWMYGVNMESDADFWGQHDKEWYDNLRKKYNAEWMPSIADKARTSREAVEVYFNGMTLKDYWTYIFPGKTITHLWAGYRSGQWRHKKESTWMRWIPREKGLSSRGSKAVPETEEVSRAASDTSGLRAG